MDTLTLTLAIAGTAIMAFLAGFMAGYTFVEKKKKVQLRRRLDDMLKYQKSYNYEETRKEPRQQAIGMCEIISPVLDSAGATTSEEEKIAAPLMNISRHGCAIISRQFIKTGLNVLIKMKIEGQSFGPKKAEVRYTHPSSRGLQIGFEFEEPLIKLP